MRRTRDYVRRFIEEGRVRILVWFLIASFVVAGIEWALSPPIYRLWLGVNLPDREYFLVLIMLAATWSAVVIAGLTKCGWAGLLMLIPMKWGLLPVYMFFAIYWSCLHGNCP